MINENKKAPLVVITKISPRWNYFQVFLLGFYQLQEKGSIRLKFDCGLLFFLSRYVPNISLLVRILYKVKSIFSTDSYNMEGYVEKDGKRKTFCIDSADAPFLFDSELLDKVDCYFKMQCPKTIDPELGFRLSDDVIIPYSDHRHVNSNLKKLTDRGERLVLTNLKRNVYKVKPCVVGFRQLSLLNSFRALNDAYIQYKNSFASGDRKKAMCYFGNSKGPVPSKMQNEKPDWDWESDIMGYYGALLNHPNEKRSRIAAILASKGDDFDSRIICDDFSDTNAKKRTDLVVPLDKFCGHVSQFQYNVNVSGYRMSIPNRFMESFIVGTAILTDQLAVKWYLPFDDEVVETVEMGYLRNETVDWESVEKCIESLPDVSSSRVLNAFERKWSPISVAKYIVESV